MSARMYCEVHGCVLIERFRREEHAGGFFDFPTGEFYCWQCERAERGTEGAG